MQKRLFILHGWSGNSEEPLMKWFGKEGDKLGFQTHVLDMPDSDSPTIDNWVGYLKSEVKYTNENTYFIGHSIGCQTIMRFLALQENCKTGTVIFIAPWLTLTNIEEDDMVIAKPWLDTPIDFSTVKKVIGKCVAIFSDNDPFVPYEENQNLFKNRLNLKIITEHNKGHFMEDDGVVDLPIAINELK